MSSPTATEKAAVTEEAAAKGPGRPRDPEADRAILEATIQVLGALHRQIRKREDHAEQN